MADDTAPHAKAPIRRQQKSIRAEADFRARLAELGVTLLDPYLGNGKPHRAICANGHPCAPLPWYVKRGGGPCKTCAGIDPKVAEAAFRKRVEELGGAVLQREWRGVSSPHLVRCVNGHECTPRPQHVLRGKGLCLICAGQDSNAAEARFRACVANLGGVVVGPWKNTHTPVHVRCAAGHECLPVPHLVFRRGSICRTCGRRDPKASWEAFRIRVEGMGGIVLEAEWKGALSPHRVRCPEGHESSPRPNDVQQGQGLCFKCRGCVWDVFYVVQDDLNDVIKFGVTSGDPRPRLGDHERKGFDQVIRLYTSLPDDVAPWLERAIISALRDAREKPVRGREYYHARVLPVVLDLVDNHPVIRSSA